MAETAPAVASPSHDDNQSLIDELNDTLAAGGDDERKQILPAAWPISTTRRRN